MKPRLSQLLSRRPALSLVFIALAATFCCARAAAQPPSPTQSLLAQIDRSVTPIAGYEIVNTFPHDPEAFTQGLVWADDRLYESTGLEGRSSLRRVELETGKVEQRVDLPDEIFAEGLASIDRRLVQLSWRNNLMFVYDRRDMFRIDTVSTEGREGWGLTSDGRHLIASDGTETLRFINPRGYETSRTLQVTFGASPLRDLNELEWIDGEIWANVWQTDLIARIDAATGKVRGWVDLSGLPIGAAPGQRVDVLNGIAWDPAARRVFVTGKLWPRLYEIRIKE